MSIAMNSCMTTRYSGRVESYGSSLGSPRRPDQPSGHSMDLLEKPSGAAGSNPTSAQALARLLDTHSWLRARKN